MGTKREAFTQRRIEALKAPAAGRIYVYDTKTPGLAVCITAPGTKTWIVYRKVNGKPVRYRLGTCDELSVADARTAALEKISEMAHGMDPMAERRKRRGEVTLADLWAKWLPRIKANNRTWRQDEWKWNTIIGPWGRTRRLSTISKRDVVEWHAKVGAERGPYLANRALTVLGTMFAMAVDEGLVNVNPARGVKRFREEKRDRFLRGDELPRFFAALTEATELIQDFVLVSLLCGARRSNVQAMKWCDIDFTTRLWRIPPEQSKNKMVVVVPLSPPVLGILERRRAAGNGSAWVFPSPRPGRAGHLVEPKRGWRAILKRAGLDDVRLHDLRRSLGSWLAISGTSMPIIGKALGHTQLKATEIYARLSLDPVAAAVEEAGNAMLAAGNGNSIVKQPQQEENSHAL